jgi:hypothetical protein
MKKQYFLLTLGLLCRFLLTAQDTSYSKINIPALMKDPRVDKEAVHKMYSHNLQFHFDSFSGYFIPDTKTTNTARTGQTLDSLKKVFSQRQHFPDSITTGWHHIILTDNTQFCREALAFVDRNYVVQLAIRDCIRIPCIPGQPVKNGQVDVIPKNVDLLNEPLHIYFAYDLETPQPAEEPGQPGYVFFWTYSGKYFRERLIINQVHRDLIEKLYPAAPNPLEAGVPFYILKPGFYALHVTKSGNDREAIFEVKPGLCLSYRLK